VKSLGRSDTLARFDFFFIDFSSNQLKARKTYDGKQICAEILGNFLIFMGENTIISSSFFLIDSTAKIATKYFLLE